MKLLNKTAVVTGGARGIGLAIAKGFAREGATVFIADRLQDEASAAAREIGGNTFAVSLDVTDRSSVSLMIETVEKQTAGIDILVNNAGVFYMAPVIDVTEEEFDRIFAVNTRALFFVLQQVARRMIERKQGGKIINLSSQAGRRGEAFLSTYCASKAAVISLTQSAGIELIKYGINVNGIAPGVVDTPMWDEVDKQFAKYEGRQLGEKKKLVGAAVPFGRMGTPEEQVGAALFLASKDADYVVAQTLNIDGGSWPN